MGVDLGDLLVARPVELGDLRGRVVAVDAYNTLYQFLAIIRQPDGASLSDRQGRVTSHLIGLIYRNASVLQQGIRPVYVFDGEPHPLKRGTLAVRSRTRTRAHEAWQEAREAGDLERARRKAQQATRLTEPMVDAARELLDLLGIPRVQAPADGEAQASHMVRRGDAWATGSQDFDALLYGSHRLVRNLALSGRRKLPRRNAYVDVAIELVHLEESLAELGLTREQLVDVALLMGTDFNEGIRGIGPKRGVALLREHGSLEAVLAAEGLDLENADEIRAIFLNPQYTEAYDLVWEPPDEAGVLRFLCDEHDFSRDRVESALQKIREGVGARDQRRLDQWSGDAAG